MRWRAAKRPPGQGPTFGSLGRDDGYYRWGSMEGAIEPWGIFCTRMKSDIITWTPQGTDELYCVRPGTFSGFLMLFSTRNGEPLAIMNDGILHHLRVAAGAALGVRYLARENASVVGGTITKTLHGKDEDTFYLEYASALKWGGHRRHIYLQTNAKDKETLKRYRAVGVDGHHANMEVWDRKLFEWINPGKNRRVGWDNWVRRRAWTRPSAKG